MIAWLLMLLAGCSCPDDGPSLADRIAAISPRPEEEKWREIPWRADLLRARREANSQGKPIFMWIMNGSPLGCT